MAIMASCSNLPFQLNDQSLLSRVSIPRNVKFADGIAVHNGEKCPFGRLLHSCNRDLKHFSSALYAVGSGLEATITDQKKNDIRLDNVKLVVESRDDDKINVRVDLAGEETQKAFDDVLTNLARTAPPVPGFRRTKGGKTSKVPKSFLLQILGKDRVTKFLIQEIVSTTIRDYVEKEKLTVKSQFKTIQSAEELESAFTPGGDFGFNAAIEIVKSDTDADEATEPDST